MDTLNDFHRLSQLLTGFNDLSLDISEGYYKKLSLAPGYQDHLNSLINLIQQASTTQQLVMLANNEQRAVCKGMTFLWYTGELIGWPLGTDVLDKNRLKASHEKYYSGLIWKTIRAHPPGLSGGYYGYWKYEPEN